MRVYYLENVRYTKSGWNDVFESVVRHLMIHHDAKVIHRANHRCQGGTTFYVEEFDYHMPDCELLIYDEKIDSLKIISQSEFYTKSWEVLTKRNNTNDLLIVPQLYDWFNKNQNTGENLIDFSKFNFKISSSVFYTIPHENVNYEEIYKQRKEKSFDELEDKLFMLFTTQRNDPYKLSELGYLNKDTKPVLPPEYFQKAINHKIGLSIATLAEYCYRDIEYMAVGIPFMRVEYLRDLNPPLIPNHHYIAIDRKKYGLPYNSGLDRVGGEKYVEAYIDRFLEVKDDKEFLNFVANNGRDYYVKYCSPQNRLNHILGLLNIDPNLKLVY